ncbi:UDP-galactose-lipid carrier transferase [hydrothermal vent metagenome]|uniref:UDP-galactose-lipid carrier transferase n=1 Tax=hydrothermal vent metagenome TaxID=652676 RepID=A0A1W1EJG4_9ZZZZ
MSKKEKKIVEDKELIAKKKKKKKRKNRVAVWRKIETIEYEKELVKLQVELLKLQTYVKNNGLKVLILFEGRDAAGKGGVIRRITEHINPRGLRVVALEKPSDVERSQWYFQRYVTHLPSAGEMVIMDRSWYNRAGVETVMNFCTQQQHLDFLEKVPKFENMIISEGIILFKFYLSISKDEQSKRFESRKTDPLKQHKLSPVDQLAQKFWDKYTVSKFSMLMASHNRSAPWTIIKANNKKKARINTIKSILNKIDYTNKIDDKELEVDKSIAIDGSDEIMKMEKEMSLSFTAEREGE